MKTTASSGPRNAPTNDYLGKRKFLVVLGYGLSGITSLCSRWRHLLFGCSALGSLTGSAKASVARRAML